MADKRTDKGQFPKGQSGNPKGRKQGSRNRVTVQCENLLEGESEALTRKAIEMALEGDVRAMRLCMERIAPPRKERKIKLDLGELEGLADHPGAIAKIAAAVSSGEVTPGEAVAVSAVLDTHRRSLESADLAERLAAIEERLGNGSR